MTEREWRKALDDLITRYQRRIRRLHDIAQGKKPKAVKVKSYWVKRHKVNAHTRYY